MVLRRLEDSKIREKNFRVDYALQFEQFKIREEDDSEKPVD